MLRGGEVSLFLCLTMLSRSGKSTCMDEGDARQAFDAHVGRWRNREAHPGRDVKIWGSKNPLATGPLFFTWEGVAAERGKLGKLPASMRRRMGEIEARARQKLRHWFEAQEKVQEESDDVVVELITE